MVVLACNLSVQDVEAGEAQGHPGLHSLRPAWATRDSVSETQNKAGHGDIPLICTLEAEASEFFEFEASLDFIQQQQQQQQ